MKEVRLRDNRGFTLIELILVIVVLGILAIAALPNFYDVSSQAEGAARDGVVGAVNSGINLFKADALVNGTTPLVPAALDGVTGAASPGTQCVGTNACFDTVISAGVIANEWYKINDTTYSWSGDGGTTLVTYTYSTANENFICTANCP